MGSSRVTSYPLPRLTDPNDVVDWATKLVDQLELTLQNMDVSANIGDASGFATSNVTTTKNLNASSTSTSNLANVLGSVINALRERGVLA